MSAGILIIMSGLGLGFNRCRYTYRSGYCNEKELYILDAVQLIAGLVELGMAGVDKIH